MKSYDAIVVGAGTGGCLTAKTVASKGLDVCLIDRKKKNDVGKKVCGNAIGKQHFDKLDLEYPEGEELERKIFGIKVCSPSMETVFYIKGTGLHGFIVNRHLFGQRLLRKAIDAGSTFLDETQVLKPIIKDNFVTGVLVRDPKTRRNISISSRVVVDASGYSAVLRKTLSPEIGVDLNVEKKDVVVCYREIRELKDLTADPEYCGVYLNPTIAPGGYYWVFPEGGTKVNVGLGVAMSERFPKPRTQLYENVFSQPQFNKSKILNGGAWYVPTRRPLDCMVGNGILVVGDAACQVNPIHGGGMGPSMMAGTLAGKTIVEAIEKGDIRLEGLWSYNLRYMQSYGAKQAGLDVFRMFLQSLSSEEIDYGMKYRLITEEDILKTSMGEDIRLNISEVTIRAFKGLRKLAFLNRLRRWANLLRKMKTRYRNYPVSPHDFEAWRKNAHDLLTRVG